MPIAQFQVDAFTDKPFAGNPAAVCLLGQVERDASWMQFVAAENNLSETAFIAYNGDGSYGIRWFTPAVEVDLCGHATLASAHVLWEHGVADPGGPITFRCAAHGELVCTRSADGAVSMVFPADPVSPADPPAGLIDAIGASPVDLLRGREDFLFVVDSDADVLAVTPDFRSLAQIAARGVIVTAPGAGGYDVASRCFFPRYGIDEDPVTGSAHCTLGPYWSAKLGKNELVCRQASRRGGEVRVALGGTRVTLTGHAVTTVRGELLV